ncbi:hypothetical protein [Embleya sp. NBC_00896]|nr:hypothetical protein OG928_23680 [Embleya sp. NBC_00896]
MTETPQEQASAARFRSDVSVEPVKHSASDQYAAFDTNGRVTP